jgi:hypothetical protein
MSPIHVVAGFAGAEAGGAKDEIRRVFADVGFDQENVHVATDAELGLMALD